MGLPGLLSKAPEARETLQGRLGLLTSAFGSAGLPLRPLTIGEMGAVVWRALHPAAAGMPALSAQELALEMAGGGAPYRATAPPEEAFTPDLSPEALASLLAPDTLLEREDSLEINGVRLSGYVVHDFTPGRPAMVHRLASLEGGWGGSMHIEVADPALVAGKLRQREVQLSAKELAKSSRGLLADYAAHQEVGAVQEQRMHMETTGQTPVFIHFFVLRTAMDEEALARRRRDLESLLATIGVSAFPARYSQLLLWRSTLPVGLLAINQKPRNMTPQSLGTFFWPAQRRLMDPDGIYLGIDENTKLPVRVDPFGARSERAPSYLILGRPGAGKSVTLRAAMLAALLNGGSVMAVDLEGEMRGFCERYAGRYIDVGSASGERINVLDIPPDSQDPLIAGVEHLVAFCEAVRGQAIPKGLEWNALAEAHRLSLEDRGWIPEGRRGWRVRAWHHKDAPRLADIVRILEAAQTRTSRSLAEMLRPYAEGVYAGYFNTPTTFDITRERLVVFGLQHVNEAMSAEQLRVYLWQVMGLIWGEVIRRRQRGGPVDGRRAAPPRQEGASPSGRREPGGAQHVMLDEVWKLLEAPGGGAAVENMARRFRKRRAALWMATQEVGEFLDSPNGRRILSVVGNTLLMEQRTVEARRLQEVFDLSDHMRNTLQQLGTGHGVLVTPEGTLKLWMAVPEDWRIY